MTELIRLGVCSSRITLAQNTIDVEAIAAKNAIHREGAQQLRVDLAIGNAPVVVYVGALTPEKHVDRVLRLHQALRSLGVPLHTVVVGDGPSRSMLAEAARTTAGFHMVGRVVEQADRFFALGDVFVLPGLGGLAINQAMANSVPVVCGRADGTEGDLIIDGVTGYYRPDFELGEWSALLYDMLGDRERCRRMGEAASAHVLRTASLGAMRDAFLASFDIASKKARPAGDAGPPRTLGQ